MNCNDFYKPYCNYQFRHLSLRTYEKRKWCIKTYFLPSCKSKEFGQVSPNDINIIYDQMENSGFAHNTIYGVRAALLSFFKLAEEYHYSNPELNPVKSARLIRPYM